jgi:hypothetical protein
LLVTVTVWLLAGAGCSDRSAPYFADAGSKLSDTGAAGADASDSMVPPDDDPDADVECEGGCLGIIFETTCVTNGCEWLDGNCREPVISELADSGGRG